MDAAFEAVAPSIRKVAQEEGVKLHEFFRDDPIWRLNFARQAGGEAVVDVAWAESSPELFTVTAGWWVDDYETTMRRLRRQAVGDYRISAPRPELEELIRAGIRLIDSWSEVDLDQKSGPFPDWKSQSKEDFVRTRLPRR